MKTLNGNNRGRDNNQIRTIIFDFDGTLADTQGAVNLAFLNTLKEIGAPIPLSPFLDAISSFTLEGMFRAVGFISIRDTINHFIIGISSGAGKFCKGSRPTAIAGGE